MHGPIREHAETPGSPFSLRGRIVESRKTSIAVEDRSRVVPFQEFCEIAQVGHSRGYEFLNSGDVKSVLVARRRLVLMRSWYDYLERLLEEQRTFTPGRHPASRLWLPKIVSGMARMPR